MAHDVLAFLLSLRIYREKIAWIAFDIRIHFTIAFLLNTSFFVVVAIYPFSPIGINLENILNLHHQNIFPEFKAKRKRSYTWILSSGDFNVILKMR